MKCSMCGSKLNIEKKTLFHYTNCGLPKIYLKGIQSMKCSNKSCGEEEVTIPNIEELHQLLAEKIAGQSNVLLPEEIRFLRTHLGFSGVDFSKVIGVSPETVSRWEKGSVNMKEATERLLRVLILTKFGPFRDYEGLGDFATKATKTALRRVFEIDRQHWQESKVA
jgi:putative transcriptional regulator